MRFVSKFFWLFVGVLFIFSGLIKLNDPVGLAIKLEEYFEVFAADFSSVFLAFKPYGLILGIFLSAAEVVLGVALLMRWKLQKVLLLLLALTVFFGILTFYSAYYNKVTDCGCFGDAIKFTPWQSFAKDMVLLVMVVVLLFTQRYLPPITNNRAAATVVALAAILSVGIAWYAYEHLPFIDFRAYKVGNNIPALMKPSAPLRYKYVMEKDGKTYEFTDYPMDESYKFKEMVALNPEDGPKITDFNVWNDEGDHTKQILQGNKLLIIIQNVHKADRDSFAEINKLIHEAEQQAIMPHVLTSSSSQDFEEFRHEVNLAAPYYFADGTVLKTMIRSNPGIMLLQDGTVKGMWHYNDTPDIGEVKKRL